MSNPNNCDACDYMKLNGNREKGHCYMWRDAPTDVCHQHTARKFPPGFTPLSEVIAELESTPEGKAAMDEGREWVRKTLYSDNAQRERPLEGV